VHTSFKRLFLLPVVLLGLLVAACESPAAALPRLDDPAEILEEALRTTAELEYVHAQLDAQLAGDANPAGGPMTYTVEGDLDLANREFHAVAGAELGDGAKQQAELLLVGTDVFIRMQGMPGADGAGQWQRTPIDAGSDPRAGLPATPAIAVALKALLADPGLEAELVGMETCGDRSCYRIEATVAPDLTWRAINGALFGGMPAEDLGPPDPMVPALTFDLTIDEATRQLLSIGTEVSVEGQSISISAAFTQHDVPFELLPPPPEQVVDVLDNVGGGLSAPARPGMILDVGNELEPSP
jgi:hypothetical protein